VNALCSLLRIVLRAPGTGIAGRMTACGYSGRSAASRYEYETLVCQVVDCVRGVRD